MKNQIFSKIILLVLGSLITLSIQSLALITGNVWETTEAWCVFNDWEARDQQARIRETYDAGRYSIDTPFGRWYCTMK